MARGTRLGFVALVFASVLCTPRAARACSCAGGTPVCDVFWKTSAVFTGEVTGISDDGPKDPPTTWLADRSRVMLRVDRVFRGAASEEIEVHTGADGGTCGYPFKRGEKYLVFASEIEGRLRVTKCSPTRPLARASEHLAYVSRPFVTTEGGQVSGNAVFVGRGSPPPPAAGFTVMLRDGSRSWTATTQPDGGFEFTGIPAGRYRIELPLGVPLGAGGPPVELADSRGCARVDFRVSAPLSVRGSVVRPNSRRARGVKVVLYSADPETKGTVVASAVSDGRGEFSMRVAAGRRYLVVGSIEDERGEVGPFELTEATAPVLIVLRR